MCALGVPSVALAHVTLLSSDPVTQSRLDTPPSAVRLRFNQPVTISSNAIEVLAPDGTVLSGTVRTEDDGYVVVAPVSGLARGNGYTVRWRVIGDDGHSPAGVFTFGVGIAAPPPTDAVGASGTTWRDDLARWGLFAALALLIGPLVVRLVILGGSSVPGALEHRFHVVSVVAAFLVIDVGIAAFVLRASNALQLPIADFPYGDLQPFAEKTRFGVAFLVMTSGSGSSRRSSSSPGSSIASRCAGPRSCSRSPSCRGSRSPGHQATEPNANWISEVADFLHLVAASVWVGGLAALAFLVWPVAPALRRTAFLGFARLAVVLVAVMVLAGAYLALVRLAEVSDLWDTLYGRFLLLKVATVGVALTWGAVHHFVVRPRLEAGEDPDVHPSLVGEVAVAFAVLLAAAILTNVAPPPVDTGTPPVARSAR